MALCGRLARRVPSLTGHTRSIAPSTYSRSFTTRSARPLTSLRSSTESPAALRQLRAFTKVASAFNKTQTAPNAEAYLKSGVISGAQDLVDVKKVLVIGSGGLSIGQAGEFDYSGKHSCPCKFVPYSPFIRFTSTQGPQGSWRQVRPSQPQYCYHPNVPRARRRNLLPACNTRIRRICHSEGEA